MSVSTRSNVALCLITDNKAGHRAQLRGLVYGFQQMGDVEEQWLSVDDGVKCCWRGLCELPKQTLVVGAGRRTLRYLVAAKLLLGLQTVALLRPRVWPSSWFSFVVPPQHDGLHNGGNIYSTDGVLSPMPPAENPDPNLGLILIGGISAHHDWDEPGLIEQLHAVLEIDPDRQWFLTNSRRTPGDFLDKIRGLNSDRLTIVPVEETPNHWVVDRLSQCGVVWVTEDSMSMVFESLSAGLQVGLLSMPRRRQSRITKCIDDLVHANRVTSLKHFQQSKAMLPAAAPLQEATRIASVIAKRQQSQMHKGNGNG